MYPVEQKLKNLTFFISGQGKGKIWERVKKFVKNYPPRRQSSSGFDFLKGKRIYYNKYIKF